jgi:hypothetical protein
LVLLVAVKQCGTVCVTVVCWGEAEVVYAFDPGLEAVFAVWGLIRCEKVFADSTLAFTTCAAVEWSAVAKSELAGQEGFLG